MILILVLSCLFQGCGKKKLTPYLALQHLRTLNSYSCSMEISVSNEKQNQVIKAIQLYLKNSGTRIEVEKERIYTIKKDNMYVKDLVNGISYSIGTTEGGIYSLSVVEEYLNLIYTDEGVKNINIDGNEYMQFNFQIPYNNKNIQKGAFYVDTKQGLPFKLCIFDSTDKKTVEINYRDFKLNAKLSQALFEVK
jgi:outer membrane lipoprotein-sorting protein